MGISGINLRWTARGRTWSSPPCSVRTSSILLVASLSKYRVDKFSAGRTICRSHMLKRTMIEHCSYSICKEYLNHTLGLTLSTPGLVGIYFCITTWSMITTWIYIPISYLRRVKYITKNQSLILTWFQFLSLSSQ